MERLMEIARKSADSVEVYSRDTVDNSISFENSRLKDIDSKLQSGTALRLFKDGKVGTAYTQNLIDREGMVQNALASLKGGVEAGYPLPVTRTIPRLASYDPAIEKLSNTQMVDECARLCDAIAPRTLGQVNSFAGSSIERLRLVNSQGTDLTCETSDYYSSVSVSYPGTYSSVMRSLLRKSFKPMDQADIAFVLDTFNRSNQVAPCAGGRMKAMFLPDAMYALVWRVLEATGAEAIYEKVSPIREKLGQKIFSEKLSFIDEALNDTRPGARAFDDEGTPCTNLVLVENGVLRSCYSDLYYASKLGTPSTGNGFRSGVQHSPHPELRHLVIQHGDKSFADMVKMMDHGIIIGGALGAHSGNILNGDYSIGLSPGIVVENGEIKGQVKDAMVAGNIYETLKNVLAVGDTLHPGGMGTFPAVLFDGVSVATRG